MMIISPVSATSTDKIFEKSIEREDSVLSLAQNEQIDYAVQQVRLAIKKLMEMVDRHANALEDDEAFISGEAEGGGGGGGGHPVGIRRRLSKRMLPISPEKNCSHILVSPTSVHRQRIIQRNLNLVDSILGLAHHHHHHHHHHLHHQMRVASMTSTTSAMSMTSSTDEGLATTSKSSSSSSGIVVASPSGEDDVDAIGVDADVDADVADDDDFDVEEPPPIPPRPLLAALQQRLEEEEVEALFAASASTMSTGFVDRALDLVEEAIILRQLSRGNSTGGGGSNNNNNGLLGGSGRFADDIVEHLAQKDAEARKSAVVIRDNVDSCEIRSDGIGAGASDGGSGDSAGSAGSVDCVGKSGGGSGDSDEDDEDENAPFCEADVTAEEVTLVDAAGQREIVEAGRTSVDAADTDAADADATVDATIDEDRAFCDKTVEATIQDTAVTVR